MRCEALQSPDINTDFQQELWLIKPKNLCKHGAKEAFCLIIRGSFIPRGDRMEGRERARKGEAQVRCGGVGEREREGVKGAANRGYAERVGAGREE